MGLSDAANETTEITTISMRTMDCDSLERNKHLLTEVQRLYVKMPRTLMGAQSLVYIKI